MPIETIRLPSQCYLQSRLDYSIVTGLAYWRHCKEQSPQWNGKNADRIAGSVRADGYATIRIDGISYLYHRVIFKIVFGEEPHELDHANRNPGHNAIHNLVAADRSINNLNRRKFNKGFFHARNSYRWGSPRRT